MLWSMEMLHNVLEMYKEKRILWDNRHPDYATKVARDEALQNIASSLDVPNVTADDVMRKLRTMRAAYRVEMRNISAAKIQGFFYNPTLKWFSAYKNCMEEIEEIKMQEYDPIESCDDDMSLEEEESALNTYVLKIKHKNLSSNKTEKSHAQIIISDDQKSQTQMLMDSSLKEGDEDVFSDESGDDEFQLFADHIGEQLRMMSRRKAVLIKHHIKKIFANDIKTNGLPQLAVSIPKSN